ncbi:MAG TPA: hypothetical protein VMJ34_09735, partial [Bryobacteraceae bacterium]|nr:hypothetical protein [Bryobacteraceae bacterium]
GFGAWYAVRVIAMESAQPTMLFVTLTVAHVLGGALTLAAAVAFTLVAYRLAGGHTAPEWDRAPSSAPHSPERAGA